MVMGGKVISGSTKLLPNEDNRYMPDTFPMIGKAR